MQAKNSVFVPIPRNVSKSTQPFQALLMRLTVCTWCYYIQHLCYSWGSVLSDDVKTHRKNNLSWFKRALKRWSRECCT